MAKSLVKQLEELKAVEVPTEEQMEKIIELEEKIAKRDNPVVKVLKEDPEYLELYNDYTDLYFTVYRMKAGEKRDAKKKELAKLKLKLDGFNYEGLFPRKLQQLSHKGRLIKLVEDIPVPRSYTDRFVGEIGEKQLKQYFK